MVTLKLNEITTQYRSFVADQVLTAKQLNTIIDYFEDQNRLTRVCLSGVGIVHGLDIQTDGEKTVVVSQGCGVTTDGDLIKYEGATFTRFKLFEDTEAGYSKFEDIGNILELYPEKEGKDAKAAELSKLSNLSEKVVVLYLENYEKEETPCTSTDCDTQGKEQIAKIRILLFNKVDVDLMTASDDVFSDNDTMETYLNLPQVAVKRAILSPTNTRTHLELMGNFVKAINNEPSPLSKLRIGISSLYKDFNGLLDIKDAIGKFKKINDQLNIIYTFSGKEFPLDIQYRYDLLKDLADTYEEIKRLLFDLRISACPTEESFPKHLLLGELDKDPETLYYQYRHSFYPSPIIPHSDERIKEIRCLIERIYLMVHEYDVENEDQIKITPSKIAMNPVSNRAIPYYYETTRQLIKKWSYDKYIKQEAGRNLGYQSQELSAADEIQNPLDYCLNKNDFFRIEGHLGKDYATALRTIDAIKKQKGLAFDVKVLSVDETMDDINIEDYKCHFEDLNTILLAFLKEQECLYHEIASFFSGFSIAEPGRNNYYNHVKELSKVKESATSGNTGEIFVSGTRVTDPAIGTIKGITAAKGGVNFSGVTNFRTITAVEDGLHTNEDDLGFIIKDVFTKNSDREACAITTKIEDRIKEIEVINNASAEIKAIAITHPYEILSFTRATSKLIPTEIADINKTRLDNFGLAVKELCKRTDTYQRALNTVLYKPEATYQRRGFESRVELLLNQLHVNCCAAEKIKVLMDDIEKRKGEILIQKTLSKFIEQHPGLEHTAGVQPGGTFVMVYLGKTRDITVGRPTGLSVEAVPIREEQILARVEAPTTSRTSATSRTSRVIKESTGIISATRVTAATTRNPVLGLELLQPERGILGEGLFTGPTSFKFSENTVIGDFSLPYLCCSDCVPINFMVPAQRVSLRLPEAFVCFKEEMPPLLFEVIPNDGIVEAVTENGLNGGVRLNEDDRFVFDPSLVSEELYGKEISFTVNGQFTDAKIVVFKKPEFDFLSSEPRYSRDGKIAVVNFTTQGDELPEGVTYLWDFGDNTIPTNRNDENPRHEYFLPVNATNTVTVFLTVSNGRCSETIDHNIELIAEPQPVNCEEQVKINLKDGQTVLQSIEKLSSKLKEAVLDPTLQQYGEITKNPDPFISGQRNNEFTNRFMPILDVTVEHIKKRMQDPEDKDFPILTTIYRLQVQLIYNILACQTKGNLKEVQAVLDFIERNLQEFRKDPENLDIDPDKKLHAFLKALSEKKDINPALKDRIIKLISILEAKK
ncbi:PKD domain-containing protein [Ulvibacter antarcticus]|uniref:PKD domain-containing protein n=1 Tax=Ulvibacter antarcticus TaxID=442714 RepID=A0A3L9YEP7_9FLAO|nr:PKD domain-containing protein [Ulvibacter antarcticus]RMA58864.1 hypothetical protein BXY75_2244 [Ulvibacter antarcticus]